MGSKYQSEHLSSTGRVTRHNSVEEPLSKRADLGSILNSAVRLQAGI